MQYVGEAQGRGKECCIEIVQVGWWRFEVVRCIRPLVEEAIDSFDSVQLHLLDLFDVIDIGKRQQRRRGC